ncbi:MAG: S8 family serine peptidase, partial [Candidatus Heimdallarchaeaceae archaeon]
YGTSYGWGTGTSFACPQVAAVVALMKSYNSTMPLSEMRTILQETATDLGDPGKDIYFGYGLLNASAALEAMLPPPDDPNGTGSTNGTSLSFVPILASFLFLTTVVLIYKRKK